MMIGYVQLTPQEKAVHLNNIPEDLRPYPQWGVCHLSGKNAKRPYNPRTGQAVDVTDPSTWATFLECWSAVVEGRYHALGFVLGEDDPFGGIDLDKTLLETTPNDICLAHEEIMQVTGDTYWEFSQSGAGFRGLFKTRLNFGGRKSSLHQIEVYDRHRFLILTGGVKHDNPIVEDTGDWLNYIVSKLPAKLDGDMPSFHDPGNVEEIIRRLENLSNWQGSKAQVLFDDGYPDDDTQSEHDQSLLDFLLQVTEDKNRIMEVFMLARGIDHFRIHNKRSSEDQFRRYVWNSMVNQWRLREARKKEIPESIRNFVPPNPQAAEVRHVTTNQTTGLPELDDLISKVLHNVPAKSSLLPLASYIRDRSIVMAGFDQACLPSLQ